MTLEPTLATLQAELAAVKASNDAMKASNAEVTRKAVEAAAAAAEATRLLELAELKRVAADAQRAAADAQRAAAEERINTLRAETRARELEHAAELAQVQAPPAGGGVSALLVAAPAPAAALQQGGVTPSLALGDPAASDASSAAPAPASAAPTPEAEAPAPAAPQPQQDAKRISVAAETWRTSKRLREAGATPTGMLLGRNTTTQALTQLGPQSLLVKLEVLAMPPPPVGTSLLEATYFAIPAPPKGDEAYNKPGFKELRDAWNPQWKEADKLASLDDPKVLEQWLYRHAAHVGANGVTHGEQALMATITPEVQSQLHATPSFVAELEGQPRGRPAAIFRWLLSHVRTINDREDVSVLPGLLYVKATHASGVEREITKVVVKNAEWAAFRSLERCKAFEARRARHLLSVFDEECIQDVTAKLQHEVGFAWTIERVVTEVRAHVELLRTARRRRRVYSRSASGRTTRSGSTPARSAPAACRRGSPRCSRNTWCCPQSPACRRRTSRRARRESATCRQRSRRRRGSTTSTAAARARRGTLTAACRPRRSSAGRISSSSSPASCATSSRLGRA